MNLRHKSSKLIITGSSGTGKSTYFTEYVLSAFKTVFDKILIFDHQAEFSQRTGQEPVFDEDGLNRAWQHGFVCFDPSELWPGQTEQAWAFFCDWTFSLAELEPFTPKLLAVDELQIFSSTRDISLELSKVVETGRKFTLDFCAISQQLNLLHNRLRNQATELIVFRQTEPLVLDILEERGFDRETVSRLETGEFLDMDLTTGALKRGNIFACQTPRKGQAEIATVERPNVRDAEPDATENNE